MLPSNFTVNNPIIDLDLIYVIFAYSSVKIKVDYVILQKAIRKKGFGHRET